MSEINYKDINKKINDFNKSYIKYNKNMNSGVYSAREGAKQKRDLELKAKIVRYATLGDVLKQVKEGAGDSKQAKKVKDKLVKADFWSNVESVLNPNNN